jgi:hypothetical protein
MLKDNFNDLYQVGTLPGVSKISEINYRCLRTIENLDLMIFEQF